MMYRLISIVCGILWGVERNFSRGVVLNVKFLNLFFALISSLTPNIGNV